MCSNFVQDTIWKTVEFLSTAQSLVNVKNKIFGQVYLFKRKKNGTFKDNLNVLKENFIFSTNFYHDR